MTFFDTHAHLDDEQLVNDLAEVVTRASNAGVKHILAVGTTADSSEKTVEIAGRFPDVHAAVGLQPNYCSEAGPDDWDRVRGLVEHSEVIALGETGLDRYWDFTPFSLQQDYFDRHLRLSQQTDLPFIVHMRDCVEDILEMLREARIRSPLRGIMHSFTGTAEMAAECVELGLHISFAGMVTFKKSADLRHTAAGIPTDRLLIETDSPYLSPHPHRGQKPNEPALMIHTAECLAETRGVTFEELGRLTTLNAHRLLRTEPKS